MQARKRGPHSLCNCRTPYTLRSRRTASRPHCRSHRSLRPPAAINRSGKQRLRVTSLIGLGLSCTSCICIETQSSRRQGYCAVEGVLRTVLPFIMSTSNHARYPRAWRDRTSRSIVICTSHWSMPHHITHANVSSAAQQQLRGGADARTRGKCTHMTPSHVCRPYHAELRSSPAVARASFPQSLGSRPPQQAARPG
jgi:hypothetical protein